VLVFLTGISPAVAGDPPEYTYRTNANEVRLYFSATDQNNHGVATLQASDFAVVDKEVIVRNFQSFTRSDWTKLEIAILIDGSESVTPHFRQEVADVLNLVSKTAGIPDENLSMFSFQGVQPVLLCAGNCRSAGTAERLPAGRAGGLTPLFDSIVFASDFLSQHGDAHAQKVLIVFSDGADTISQSSLRDAVDAALRAEVQVDCIALNRSFASSPGATVLREVASATGGRYFPPPNGATQAINVILEGFQASYRVSYRLPNRAYGFHTVQILSTHNLNLQFRSRSGYYYPDRIR
jgi:Ca-activated chloride channel family protein